MSTPPTIEIFPSPPTMRDAAMPPHPGHKRQRLILFLAIFALCLASSQAYVWLREPLYQSSASLLTTAQEAGAEESSATISQQGNNILLAGFDRPGKPDSPEHINVQRQILLGVPVFEETLRRLQQQPAQSNAPRLSLADLRGLLSVDMVKDTNLVELKAQGPKPEILAPLVNAWIDAYQALREAATQNAEANNYATLETEAQQLGKKVEAKRLALEQFRAEHDILAKTDTDNTPMLRLKGLNEALNKAIDEQAKAKGALEAIRAALARGEPVMPKEEAPGLENLEKRAQELREAQKDLNRRYTPAYLAMHPQYKQVPEQLAQVEQAIKSKAQAGSRAMLSQAEQAYAAAQQATQELQQKVAELKRESSEFTNRFAEQEALRADLERLEAMRREKQAKLAQIESKPKETYPPLQVVERAYPPTQPFSPAYWRDSGISLGGSLALALLFIWLYDYLTRIEEQTSPAPAAMPSFQFYSVQNSPPLPPREQAPAALPAQAAAPKTLESPFPRELTGHEIHILLDAADTQTRHWIGLLLSGLTLEEAADLQAENIDLDANRIHVGGTCPRTLPLPPRLKGGFALSTGADIDAEEIAARIHCAAIDSGLPQPETVDASAIRHSYIAHLVRQGIRLSELERIIGPLPAKTLASYGRHSPPGPSLPADRIPWAHPALQSEN